MEGHGDLLAILWAGSLSATPCKVQQSKLRSDWTAAGIPACTLPCSLGCQAKGPGHLVEAATATGGQLQPGSVSSRFILLVFMQHTTTSYYNESMANALLNLLSP